MYKFNFACSPLDGIHHETEPYHYSSIRDWDIKICTATSTTFARSVTIRQHDREYGNLSTMDLPSSRSRVQSLDFCERVVLLHPAQQSRQAK